MNKKQYIKWTNRHVTAHPRHTEWVRKTDYATAQEAWELYTDLCWMVDVLLARGVSKKDYDKMRECLCDLLGKLGVAFVELLPALGLCHICLREPCSAEKLTAVVDAANDACKQAEKFNNTRLLAAAQAIHHAALYIQDPSSAIHVELAAANVARSRGEQQCYVAGEWYAEELCNVIRKHFPTSPAKLVTGRPLLPGRLVEVTAYGSRHWQRGKIIDHCHGDYTVLFDDGVMHDYERWEFECLSKR